MSEERPLGREDFRRLMSHTPSEECPQLCREWEFLEIQWNEAVEAGDEDEQRRLVVLIRAVNTRMERLGCPDCLFQ